MRRHGISGIPVVERGPGGKPARLCGILTNRDVRFADNPLEPVSQLMTKNLITVREGVSQDEARRLLHQHRLEKLLVVDEDFRCVGLVTVKDMEKATQHPLASKDAEGRLRVAAASTVGDKGFERAEMLIDAGVDCVVIDTAHGHSQAVLDQVSRLKRISNKVALIAGNVATADGDEGADRRRRRRDQGRHRPRLDLHDAHRRRRRRAAAHRDHGLRGGRARRRRAGASPTAASNIPAISPRRSPPAPTAS